MVGRWTLLYKSIDKGGTSYRWICKCSCGTERSLDAGNLRNGRTKSCGCVTKERLKTVHELSRQVSELKDRLSRCVCESNK